MKVAVPITSEMLTTQDVEEYLKLAEARRIESAQSFLRILDEVFKVPPPAVS